MIASPGEHDLLRELAGLAPRRLLDELVRIGGVLASNGRARPEVELMLAGGQLVRGRAVSISDDPAAGAIAMIHTGGSPRAPAVTYVRVDQVAAVVVADASVLLRAPQPGAPAPSRLELQRQVAAKADQLSGKLGRTIPLAVAGDLDDDGRRAVAGVLPLVVEVLAAISADVIGRDALVPILALELGAAGDGEVTRDASKLIVRAPRLALEPYTHASLRKAIEKLL